ncbi:MAG: hypothetical protein GY788_15575 [bacterium]|nr:hypothetical protein [bacterium]
MADCPQPIELYGYRKRDMEPVTTEVRCKRYTCEACGPQRRARIHKMIQQGVAYGRRRRRRDPARFITLTYPNKADASFDSAADMRATSERFRRLVQIIRRHGLEFEYCRVLERTKKGRIHVHVLAWGDYLPNQLLQAWAHHVGFGWVDIRAVKTPKRASRYMAKYLTKQGADYQWPKYARRFSYSRLWANRLTLAQIDEQWLQSWLDTLPPEQLAEREDNSVIWLGLTLKRRPHELMPHLPPPGTIGFDQWGRPLPNPWPIRN